MDLNDVGTVSVVGGVVGESAKRVAAAFGWRWKTDAWREAMFVSGAGALIFWVFRKLAG